MRRVSILRLYPAVILPFLLLLSYQLLRMSKDILLPTHQDGDKLQRSRHKQPRRDRREAYQNDVDKIKSRPIHHQMMEFSNRSEMIDHASRSFPKWNGPKNAWCVMNRQEQQQNHHLALRDLKRLHQQQQQQQPQQQLPPLKIMELASPNPQGLMFSKTFKTGSSTATSVSLQIAHQVARREQKSLLLSLQQQQSGTTRNSTSRIRHHHSIGATPPKCRVHMTHEVSLENRLFPNRNVTSSILWTIVRNPVQRAISAFYFYKVGIDQVEPNDANLIAYLQGTRHQQVIQLRLDRPPIKETNGILKHNGNNNNNDKPLRRLVDYPLPDFVADLEIINTAREDSFRYKSKVPEIIRQEIMNRFDFVAVQDRLDESLVVFKLLFDLNDEDIIVLSSKRTGSYSWNWKRLPVKECFQIPSMQPLSAAVQDYLQTNYTWQNNADFLLHAIANQSLDWTIDHVLQGGRALVQQHVQRHRQLQSLVQEHCQHKAIFPCDDKGRYQEAATHDCFFRDMGCGYRCIDNVLDLYRQGKLQLPI
jgi:hypothetical protein